jgi:NAD(P)-dependent dehydrogenase (short-subunit alcohol dehydrogenase family)
MQVAVVTGAGTGIGRASSIALSQSGWKLVLVGRRQETLNETANLVQDECLVVPTDIGNPDSVTELFAEIRNSLGRVDLLFNNAGTGTPAISVEDLSVDQWTQVVNTNLTGTFLCAQQAVSMMKAQDPMGGRIINNGSLAAYSPRPDSTAYTATKHAITGLTKSLALDGRAFDISCGQIDIGNVATLMTSGIASGVVQADRSVRPEPTFEVEHAAAAVVFMANLPLDVNVLSLTIMAAGMPYVGRG